MARSRSLPTNLFEDPDFFERNRETQVILLGLILDADDAGRGQAHTGLLARKFNTDVATIEMAMAELQACEMLDCYQVGRHSYYSLRRWQEWQTLSKPTPSKFPAPPTRDQTLPVATTTASVTTTQAAPTLPQYPLGNPGQCGETLSEGEEEEEGEAEREENQKGTEEEGAVSQPGKVILFPTTGTGTTDPPSLSLLSEEQLATLTTQVASILQLPISPALLRIVQDYGGNAALSLLGEADAAREWIDDARRNHKQKAMSTSFFRRWVKREVEERLNRQVQQVQATGTTGMPVSSSPPRRSSPAPTGAISAVEDQYQQHLQRRVQAVRAGHGKAGQ